MSFVEKYLKRHVRPMESTASGKPLRAKMGYWTLGATGFLILWEVFGLLVIGHPDYRQFSGLMPLPALKALLRLFSEGAFWNSALASLRRVAVGVIMAFAIGMPLGLLIGFYSKLRVVTHPPVQFLRMISPLSWMPIALILFSSFEAAIYFLIAMAAVWPIILNTALGVSRVNPQWLRMARNEGAKGSQLLRYIVLPASIPYIISSLRLGLGVAWIVLVPAEFLGVSSGLGYIINDARDTMEYDRLMAVVIAIGMIGFCLDGAIQWFQNAFNWNWVRYE